MRFFHRFIFASFVTLFLGCGDKETKGEGESENNDDDQGAREEEDRRKEENNVKLLQSEAALANCVEKRAKLATELKNQEAALKKQSEEIAAVTKTLEKCQASANDTREKLRKIEKENLVRGVRSISVISDPKKAIEDLILIQQEISDLESQKRALTDEQKEQAKEITAKIQVLKGRRKRVSV
jgi:hypothetical protein